MYQQSEDWNTQRQQAQERAEKLRATMSAYKKLVSVVNALYLEVDKLAKKWPEAPTTQLYVDKTNQAIKAVKELMRDEKDEFIEELQIFIPAGDLPEHRDVLLILGQIKAALDRFEEIYSRNR